MHQLSPTAHTMLERRPRRRTITDRDAIIDQIVHAGIPVFEPIVAFQAQYGGYEYVVRGAPTTGFLFDLFEGFDVNEPWEFDARQDAQGQWCFCCGSHAAAQLVFYISQVGAVRVEVADDLLLPIATSVKQYIESDAMREGLMHIRSKWWEISFDVAAADRAVDVVLAQGRTVVDVASDTYTTWWANDQTRVVRFTMFKSDATNRVTAYLPSRDAAAKLAEAVSSVLGETPEVFSYPVDIEEHRAASRRRRQALGLNF
jgi:hypothetical protein